MKLGFVYRIAVQGGVVTQLAHRLGGLSGRAESHVVFMEDRGARPTLEGLAELAVRPTSKSVVDYFRGHGPFEAITVIDTPLVAWAMKERLPGQPMFVEVHTTTASIEYLRQPRGFHRQFPALRRVITPSGYMSRRLAEDFHIPSELISVVENSVDPTVFRPEGSERTPERPIVLWVGKLDDHKNWRDFVDSAEIIDLRQDAEFWMVTHGRLSEAGSVALRRAIDRGSLYHRIRWIHGLPYTKMPGLYRLAATSGGCLLVTSVDESFGMVVLEAQASGLPVVASRVGALPERIREGDSGFLYPVHHFDEAANIVLSLLRDEALRSRLSASGRASALKYNPTRSGGQYLSVLRASG